MNSWQWQAALASDRWEQAAAVDPAGGGRGACAFLHGQTTQNLERARPGHVPGPLLHSPPPPALRGLAEVLRRRQVGLVVDHSGYMRG